MEIIWLIGGIVIGGLAVWFIAKFKFDRDNQQAQSSVVVEQERATMLKSETEELKKSLDKERNSVLELNNQLSTTEANYRNLQEKLNEQKKELEDIQEKFSIQFKNLANEIFEEKSKKYS